jgi:hypothetical protein
VPVSHKSFAWWPKRFFELMLRPFSSKLDALVMRRISQRAFRMHGKHFEKRDFDVAFKATPHISKNHRGNYQRKITDKFNERVSSFFSEMVPQ